MTDQQSTRSSVVDSIALLCLTALAWRDKIDRFTVAIVLLGFFQSRGFVGAAGKLGQLVTGNGNGGGPPSGGGGTGSSSPRVVAVRPAETPPRDPSSMPRSMAIGHAIAGSTFGSALAQIFGGVKSMISKRMGLLAAAAMLAGFTGPGCYSMEHPPNYPDYVIYPKPYDPTDLQTCPVGIDPEDCPAYLAKHRPAKLVRLSDDKRCQTLSDREMAFGGVAAGAALLGGSSGLGSVWTDSKNGRIALATGGVVAAGVAAAAAAMAHSAAVAHAAECGHAAAPAASASSSGKAVP